MVLRLLKRKLWHLRSVQHVAVIPAMSYTPDEYWMLCMSWWWFVCVCGGGVMTLFSRLGSTLHTRAL